MAMPSWGPGAVVILASLAMVAIRAPHGQRSRAIAVVKSHRGKREVFLLALAWVGFLLAVVWAAIPRPLPLDRAASWELVGTGTFAYVVGLVLLYLSHRDLGRNWSITLELREGHELVDQGVYRRLRHPMYTAFLLFGLGQALVLPNWIAGPSYLVAFVLLVVLRLPPEERMMRETFGAEWDAYVERTKRLVPGVW